MKPKYGDPYNGAADRVFLVHLDGYDIWRAANGFYVGVWNTRRYSDIIVYSHGNRSYTTPFPESVYTYCEFHRKLSS